jgi:N-acetylglucosamine-6-phosphate deacetylase
VSGGLLIAAARPAPGEPPRSILIRDGRVVAVGPPREVGSARGLERLDAEGAVVAPGFLDLQVNGAVGHDITADPASIWAIGDALTRWGVTAWLPTIVSAPSAIYAEALAVFEAGPPAGYRGARPLGFHFEGPFLAPERHGAHDPSHVRPIDRALVSSWTRDRGVAMATLAPEIPGATELVRWLRGCGMVVSAGHSNATAAQASAGFDAGIRSVTHLWNAMSGLDHRAPGLVGAALGDPRVALGVIPDGLHVAPDVVRLTQRIAGRRRFVAVTDAIAALGRPDGTYPLGGMDVSVSDGVARLPDGRLAGSVLSLDGALRNLVAWSGGHFADALAAVTSAPAALIRATGRGRLGPNDRADLVVLDDDLVPLLTLIGGEVVFDRSTAA